MSANPFSQIARPGRFRLARLGRDVRGGVTIIAALSLTSILGMTGLAMEVSQGYATKVANQRIADAAALAAAMAYAAASDTSVVQPTASAIAMANGLAGTAVVAPAPTTDASNRKVITATVTTAVPLRLTRILTSALSYNVVSVGVAAVTPATAGTTPTGVTLPGCLYALSGSASDGILVSGASTINAPSCSVVANSRTTVSGSASITAGTVIVNGNIVASGTARVSAKQITASGTFNISGSAQITATPDASKKYQNTAVTVTDPLAGNAALSASLDKTGVAANFPTPAALTSPVTPASSVNWTFDGSGGSGTGINPAWQSGSTWNIPAGTYNLNKLTINGDGIVKFAAGSTVTISNGLSVAGSRQLSVGNGANWKVNGGVAIGGSGNGGPALTLGNGTYHFAGAFAMSGSGNVSIGNGNLTVNGATSFDGSGTLTVGVGAHAFASLSLGSGTGSFGDGDLTIVGALTKGGSGNLSFGDGNIAIGGTTSISVGGSGILSFSGTGLGRTFTTAGGITTAGSSELTLPASANHFIGGTMQLSGSVNFAPASGSGTVTAGAYTVRGDFTKAASMYARGSGISFFLSGALTWSGASGGVFSAPTDPAQAAGDALVNILFASRTTSPTNWTGSTSNTYTGMIYFPNSAMTLSGSGSLSGCFGAVGATITVTGSGAAALACSGVAAATPGATTGTTTSGTPAVVSLVR